MNFETVVIRKIKRPKGIHRWPAYVMEEDPFGTWLYSPKGTVFRGQVGSEYAECEVGQGNRAEGLHVMHLIPNEGWWVARWALDHIGVDICTPPELKAGEWHFIDLELDPLAFLNGRIVVEDEDEFEAACEAGIISEYEAREARKTATEIEGWLHDKTEPFGRVGWDKLEKAVSLSLPPIQVLEHLSIADEPDAG